jgi:hypothetical protein
MDLVNRMVDRMVDDNNYEFFLLLLFLLLPPPLLLLLPPLPPPSLPLPRLPPPLSPLTTAQLSTEKSPWPPPWSSLDPTFQRLCTTWASCSKSPWTRPTMSLVTAWRNILPSETNSRSTVHGGFPANRFVFCKRRPKYALEFRYDPLPLLEDVWYPPCESMKRRLKMSFARSTEFMARTITYGLIVYFGIRCYSPSMAMTC